MFQKGRMFDALSHILLDADVINQRHVGKDGDRSARLCNCSKNTSCAIFEDVGKFRNNCRVSNRDRRLLMW